MFLIKHNDVSPITADIFKASHLTAFIIRLTVIVSVLVIQFIVQYQYYLCKVKVFSTAPYATLFNTKLERKANQTVGAILILY